jgi:arabinogalactan endo-1,4-beta-galactosidase
MLRPFLGGLLLIGFLLSGCSSPEKPPPPIEQSAGEVEKKTIVSASPTPSGPDEAYLDHIDNRPLDQPVFFLGVDLSYVNEMDDCGAIYRENGQLVDAFDLFSERGANLVRARLWHNAEWTDYSNLEDIKRTFHRANQAGMFTLLDFHYSDNWADPSKQAIPEAWEDFNEEELVDAVYNYTYQTLIELDRNQLMPDFVQVGNETNSGLVKKEAGLDWPRDAKLFNAGIQAVRDAGMETNSDIKIILHVAQPENAGWWFREARDYGVTDFDIIGLSYYPQWSMYSITDLGAHVTYLKEEFQKEMMIVETAYLWTMDAVEETAGNILNQGIRGYSFSPEGQRLFMVDQSQAVISNGGLGIIYWEPAWVSTQCSTRWGQGSHWENATFFDFKNGNEVHQGIDFLNHPYLYPEVMVDGQIEIEYGAPLVQDTIGDNFQQVNQLDLADLFVRQDGDFLYLALTVAGNLYDDPWGNFLLYFDTTENEDGATSDVGRRPINTTFPYLPEYRLDIHALERKGTISPSLQFYAWNGTEWNERTFTGGVAIQSGSPSTIELQIPLAVIGNPQVLNLAIVSTGRGRVHTAGDVLGTVDTDSISDWREEVILKDFVPIDLYE